MVTVALTGVVISTLTGAFAVDRTLETFGRKDLELSADHTAAVAAHLYRRDGAWTPGNIAELGQLEAVQGHTVIVRDAGGRPLQGSAPSQADPQARATVVVSGRPIGEISLAHRGGGFLRLLDSGDNTGFTEELHHRIRPLYLVSGLIAGVIGMLIAIVVAVRLSRPVRRLTRAAEEIEAGNLDARANLDEGGKELRQLSRTLDRVAATLKRQEEIRRETVDDLAHELRTPLTGLRARIEAAQDGVLVDIPAALAAMHDDVLRLGRLTEDFERLAVAQQPGLLLDMSAVDLAALAHSRSAAFADAFADRDIELLTDIEPATTYGDASRLGQVIDNLLSNALRYTDPWGRVIVRVVEGRSESIIEVADTGTGIAPDELPRIFDRFWRSDKSRSRATGGSGLGLALVRELVEVHDGSVDVQSMPGHGTRFRVHLPVAPPPTHPLLEFEELGRDGRPVCVGRIVRDIRPADWRSIRHALGGRLDKGHRLLAIDVRRAGRLPQRALMPLVTAQAEIEAQGGRLVVIAANVPRGASLLTIVPDLESALQELLADPVHAS
jgi:two-component system sensor histidine kinase BaeS